MHVTVHTIALLTAADGSCTAYSTQVVNGRILAIRYTKTDFADTVDFVITGDASGEAILTVANVTASTTWKPRAQVHDVADGSAMTYDGTRKRAEPVVLANERIKVVLAQGGNAKTGQLEVLVG